MSFDLKLSNSAAMDTALLVKFLGDRMVVYTTAGHEVYLDPGQQLQLVAEILKRHPLDALAIDGE